MRTPLTLDELIEALIELRTRYPEQGPRPVHLMDMADDGDGLVTDVDLDSFDEEQNTVTSLLSSPRDIPQDPDDPLVELPTQRG